MGVLVEVAVGVSVAVGIGVLVGTGVGIGSGSSVAVGTGGLVEVGDGVGEDCNSIATVGVACSDEVQAFKNATTSAVAIATLLSLMRTATALGSERCELLWPTIY